MPTFLFSGGYTHDASAGIHVFDASEPGGPLTPLTTVDHVQHPSFLCTHPTGTVLYAVSETSEFDGEPGGGLVAFRFDPSDGSLEEIDRTSSHGDAPCHIAVDPDGRYLHVANYLSGSVAAHALAADGRFEATVAVHQHDGRGPTERQEGPHAHCAQPTADGRRVYAVDLGTDQIIRYDRTDDPTPTFVPAAHTDVPAGTGPRHIVLHPERPLAAVIGELDNSVTLHDVTPDGSLRARATASTRPPDATVFAWSAAVRFSPDGRHVYTTSRGDDTIAVFALGDDGLQPIGYVATGGRTPRDMTFHPAGSTVYIANQDSDRITTFALDDGPLPRRLDHDVEVAAPTCVITLEVAA